MRTETGTDSPIRSEAVKQDQVVFNAQQKRGDHDVHEFLVRG